MAKSKPAKRDKRTSRYESGIEAAVEEQRTRMMRAEAVINCLNFAILHMEGEKVSPEMTTLQLMTSLASDLIRESIDGLDSVRVLGTATDKR